MEELFLIIPNPKVSKELTDMIKIFCENFSKVTTIINSDNLLDLKEKKILFTIEVGFSGIDLYMWTFLESLKTKEKDFFYNSTATLLVHSSTELFTKDVCQNLIFITNSLGCRFIGHPIIEATASFKNFLTWQKTLNIPLEKICLNLCHKLGKRLLNYTPKYIKSPKITALYSSPHTFSNTLSLWHMASCKLKEYDINEIQIENGKVQECKGCSYKTCLHYGKQNSCFYGGFMVENILPAINGSDIVVWLCPNYNDAISSNISATINRLTVLYRKASFYDKCLLGVIVSGNSGSDSVAKQLIGALNINKGFLLPPYALLMETANDPKAIFKIPNIEKKAQKFALNIKKINCK
ncbi:NAD(P)H-dependent oxidoreductase [Clostridium sporogenes]|uniref:NADPH-dependent oxidoreductase n=1 Tax=Clostridium botulinum TaxID=1491 RepID=A0A6M0T1N2_CLOBO|nr:NAD(P)H-dependent oxidoreductase [Clostridium sporogenes]NFA61688.1 NADPH-dependent oxidoreductase [Clostridium botulinum]NFI75522.1 NAD(P)H-dependent oxidoreductase [Clostridium sporogenes]NFL73746.1 NAD(P)H-dependent oxidoreductase [Clostridium sporogenes]NFM25659.1 NAD(P)H-dependent oxidoreductase [Clostridium sporogenes]NFP63067.1 NAD(P)H-dependent oxidoreductase [Clostridium sporogenes]